MSNTERIIDKIKRLIRYERSARKTAGTSGKIRQLLTAHKIEISQATTSIEFVPDSRMAWQKVRLGDHVHQTVVFQGAPRRIAPSWLRCFDSLLGTMKRLARVEEELTRKKRLSVRRFKPYFYSGFTHAVNRRYEALRAVDVECVALVRADALVKRYVEENHETEESKPRKSKKRVNRNGYFAGVVAGSQVDLGTNVLEGQ